MTQLLSRSRSGGHFLWAALALLAGAAACSESGGGKTEPGVVSSSGGGPGGPGGPGASSGGQQGATDDGIVGVPGEPTDPNAGGAGGAPTDACESAQSETELRPLLLAFAFDVSGSMGALDRPNWWHDPEVKWKPVVEATQAFFEAPDLTGISASLVLFPTASGTPRCEASSYETPDVAMQPLPSTAFSAVFSGYENEVGTPLAGGAWRGGTPTLFAHSGAAAYLEGASQSVPEAERAVVLVTDGLPQGCSGAELADVVAQVATVAQSGIPTYVIGIQNPTTPPSDLPDGWSDWGSCSSGTGGGATPCPSISNLDELNQIADAGGTDSAFLIDTGDPAATRATFLTALAKIRTQAASCSLSIPEAPDGSGTFDKDKIDVTVTTQNGATLLSYDPSCQLPDAWHYDDENAPAAIELCEGSCSHLQATPDARVDVTFRCDPRPDVVK